VPIVLCTVNPTPAASAWITTRPTKDGGKRYRVEYRLGGSRTRIRYGGSFKRKQDAATRRNGIAGELAARRVPTFELLSVEPPRFAGRFESSRARERNSLQAATFSPTVTTEGL
jgi:hypothetical protein